MHRSVGTGKGRNFTFLLSYNRSVTKETSSCVIITPSQQPPPASPPAFVHSSLLIARLLAVTRGNVALCMARFRFSVKRCFLCCACYPVWPFPLLSFHCWDWWWWPWQCCSPFAVTIVRTAKAESQQVANRFWWICLFLRSDPASTLAISRYLLQQQQQQQQ